MLKKAQRLLSMLLVLTMILSVMSGLSLTALAADAAKITVESKTVDVSTATEVELAVTLADNPGFSAGAFVVDVGEAPLTFKSAKAGKVLTDVNATFVSGATISCGNGLSNITDSGELMTLTFTVNSGAKNGEYQVKLALLNGKAGNFSNADEEDVPVEFVAGTVTITGATVEPEPVKVPVKKADVQDAAATIQTGSAYILSDLQNGNIFAAPEGGEALQVTNYYYEYTADNGESGAKTAFEEGMHGTTLSVTPKKAGMYTYKFYASYDGVNFSAPWTLKLTVSDEPVLEYTFYVGQSPLGGTPKLYLYAGEEATGTPITLTSADAVSNFTVYKATLPSGRYTYRVEDETNSVMLGGMSLTLPTEKNPGGAGGITDIYLRCMQFIGKSGSTYLTREQFTVEVVCPKMNCNATLGSDAKLVDRSKHDYYAAYLYAGGNSCLYNFVTNPAGELSANYMFKMDTNRTLATNGASALSFTGTISTKATLTVNYPEGYEFDLYHQLNNFNTEKIEATSSTSGQKVYTIATTDSNYTWRLSSSELDIAPKAGWLSSLKAEETEVTVNLTAPDKSSTTALELDAEGNVKGLGTQTKQRDEADIYVGVSATGYKTLTGTERVRAYRMWEIINNDSSNIMIEPEFIWKTIRGDASATAVSGGNAKNNWADITPGTEDTLISVRYGAIDVYTDQTASDYGSHGGLFPTTSPSRVAVMVIGGTGVAHGNAKAHLVGEQNGEWNYNYDTWFYTADDPTMSFTTDGSVESVEYVTFTPSMFDKAKVTTLSATEKDGVYTVEIPSEGTNVLCDNGGTVVIKMNDGTGVSYQLVRVSKVTVKTENTTNPDKKVVNPGDRVKVTFSGLYRGVDKMSGIYNPMALVFNYKDAADKAYTVSINQYARMDKTAIELQAPANTTFADGETTAEIKLYGQYISGQMWASPSPWQLLYDDMTDKGVGTNFGAVQVKFQFSRLTEATVTVTKEDIPDGKWDGYTTTEPDKDESGVYQIGTPAELAWFAKEASKGEAIHGKLMADIDLYNKEWTPIGTDAAHAFQGSFDGNGHTVTGLYVYAKAAPANSNSGFGLFGAVSGTTEIKNLTVEGKINVTATSKTSGVAGVVGHCASGAALTMSDVTNKVDVSFVGSNSGTYAGGVVGNAFTATVNLTRCVNNGSVTSKAYGIGGVIGGADAGKISECYNTGSLVKTNGDDYEYIGGVAGRIAANAAVENCYNTGSVTVNHETKGRAAGIIGRLEGTVKNAYSVGTVTAAHPSAAVSYIDDATIENCYVLNTQDIPAVGDTADDTRVSAVTVDEMKGMAEKLGAAFANDASEINGGYPILAWQCTHEKKVDKYVGHKDGTHTMSTVCAGCGKVFSEGEPENCAYVDHKCSKCGDDALLVSIAVTTQPTKTSYVEGQKFEMAGMVVTAYYNDNTSAEVTGYEYAPKTELATTDNKITVTYEGKTAEVTITVAAKAVERIAVTTQPKTSYVEGQMFDPAGMVVTAKYNDGSEETVTGYTVAPDRKLTTEDTTVTISYEGKTATVEITVAPKTLTKIEVTTAPSKTTYVEGQDFDKTGMVVKAFYDNDTEAEVDTYTITDGTRLTTDKTSITISYTEGDVTVTTTTPITVIAKAVTEIEITKQPDKLDYIEGLTFDPTGMEVTAKYNDGTSNVVTDYDVVDGANLTTGKTSVTISYEGKTATVAISVAAKAVEKLEIVTDASKLDYIEGQEFDPTGMTVKVTYDNDTTETIDGSALRVVGGELTPGQTEVTLSYGGKTVKQSGLTVVAKTLIGIEIAAAPSKTTYRPGENFDDSGMVVKAKYDNGKTEVITDYTIVDGDNLQLGTTSVTISYKGFTAEQEITVRRRSSGSVTKPVSPNKSAEEKTLPFTDVSSKDWFYDGVKYAYDNGLMTGVSGTRFAPNADTTRGMIVTILARMEGVNTNKSTPWYAAGRSWAMRNDISDGTNMTAEITREQLAAMLYRYAKLKGYDVSASKKLSSFTDASSVSSWAVEAMQWAVAEGLIEGSGSRLNPQATATRAQVATILMRFAKLTGK